MTCPCSVCVNSGPLRSTLVYSKNFEVIGVRHSTSAWGHPVVHGAELCVMCVVDGVVIDRHA